jgi:hypothetical protein
MFDSPNVAFTGFNHLLARLDDEALLVVDDAHQMGDAAMAATTIRWTTGRPKI